MYYLQSVLLTVAVDAAGIFGICLCASQMLIEVGIMCTMKQSENQIQLAQKLESRSNGK